jgi:hypothetical protein
MARTLSTPTDKTTNRAPVGYQLQARHSGITGRSLPNVLSLPCPGVEPCLVRQPLEQLRLHVVQRGGADLWCTI